MTRANRQCVAWVITDVLRIQSSDKILEVQFGFQRRHLAPWPHMIVSFRYGEGAAASITPA